MFKSALVTAWAVINILISTEARIALLSAAKSL